MKLILLLQRKSWFIEHGGRWSPLADTETAELALTALPLVCVNEFDLSEQPVQYGRAEINAVDETAVVVRIIAPNGSEAAVEHIPLSEACLCHAAWDQPPANDGWIGSIVRLETENVRRLTLKTYLPPADNSEGKSLRVRNDATGEEKELFMERGRENDLVILESAEPQHTTLVISCDAEAANDSADVRSLGFVLLDKVVGI